MTEEILINSIQQTAQRQSSRQNWLLAELDRNGIAQSPEPAGILVSGLSLFGGIALMALGLNKLGSLVYRGYGRGFSSLLAVQGARTYRDLLQAAFAGLLAGNPFSALLILMPLMETSKISRNRLAASLSGVNLGASLSLWLILLLSFPVVFAQAGLLLLAVALPYLMGYRFPNRNQAEFLLGTGLVLLGARILIATLWGLHQSTALLSLAVLLFGSWWGLALAFFLGACFTVLYPSSLTLAVLVLSLRYCRILDFNSALLLLLGAHWGSTLSLFLALRSHNRESRQLGLLQLFSQMLSFILTVLFYMAIRPVLGSSLFIGTSPNAQIPWVLAVLYSSLGVLTSLCIYLLRNHFLNFSPKVMSEKATHGSLRSAQQFGLSPQRPEFLEASLLQTQGALAEMSEKTADLLMIVMNASQLNEIRESSRDEVEQLNLLLTQQRSRISQSLILSVQQPCTTIQAEVIQLQQRIAHELKGIGDDCKRIMAVLYQSYRKQFRIHDQGQNELFAFSAQVLDFLQYNSDYLQAKILDFDWTLAK